MASEAGKGHAPRPLSIPRDQFNDRWAAAFGPKLPAPPPFCPVHRRPIEFCGCMPTDDGPGQEVKTHYERRNFEGDL